MGLFAARSATPANSVLFYVKGGAAVAPTLPSARDRRRLSIADSVDDTRWGGTVGAGVEYGFAPKWSAGIEYTYHMFMQDKTYNFVSNGAVPGWHVCPEPHPSGHEHRSPLGINYKFRRFLLTLPAPPFQDQRPALAGVFFCGSATGPADCCCQKSASSNNRLMIRTRHWKSLVVLPMFRLSIIGA